LQNNIATIGELRSPHAKMIAVAIASSQLSGKLVDDLIFVRNVHAACQPIVPTIPVQLFAYGSAKFRPCGVDQPRNFAKSDVVESCRKAFLQICPMCLAGACVLSALADDPLSKSRCAEHAFQLADCAAPR
jgi:hypothetical protein